MGFEKLKIPSVQIKLDKIPSETARDTCDLIYVLMAFFSFTFNFFLSYITLTVPSGHFVLIKMIPTSTAKKSHSPLLKLYELLFKRDSSDYFSNNLPHAHLKLLVRPCHSSPPERLKSI